MPFRYLVTKYELQSYLPQLASRCYLLLSFLFLLLYFHPVPSNDQLIWGGDRKAACDGNVLFTHSKSFYLSCVSASITTVVIGRLIFTALTLFSKATHCHSPPHTDTNQGNLYDLCHGQLPQPTLISPIGRPLFFLSCCFLTTIYQ